MFFQAQLLSWLPTFMKCHQEYRRKEVYRHNVIPSLLCSIWTDTPVLQGRLCWQHPQCCAPTVNNIIWHLHCVVSLATREGRGGKGNLLQTFWQVLATKKNGVHAVFMRKEKWCSSCDSKHPIGQPLLIVQSQYTRKFEQSHQTRSP
jgi:hypothetical protein